VGNAAPLFLQKRLGDIENKEKERAKKTNETKRDTVTGCLPRQACPPAAGKRQK
jgi:hypothetical protein